VNDAAAVARVVASIQRFGFGAPIVARAANREIIAGHTRWLAATQLGLARVPVRLLDINAREAHVLALADNRYTELTQWSGGLPAMISTFEIADVAFAGWTQRDADRMAADLLRGREVVEDDAPEPPANPVTKLGDVWTLGRHTLVCGNALDAPAKRHGAVLADPPYGIAIVKRGMVGAADFGVFKKGRYTPIAGDNAKCEVCWLLERGDVITIWGGNYFADQLPAASGWLVWDKRADSGVENTFADCELAWSNQTGPARVHRQLWLGMIRAGEHEKRVHPTQKPVALMAWCLGFSKGDVFDPYSGSGTTLIAAEQLDRTCCGVELSPAYCDVIVERWQNLTGKSATRKGS
jgi:DNA modification methylase